jgi:hypothetical protein
VQDYHNTGDAGSVYLCVILRHVRTQQELVDRSRMAEVRGSSPLGSTLQIRLDKLKTQRIGKGEGTTPALTTPTVTPTQLSGMRLWKIAMQLVRSTCKLGGSKLARVGLRRCYPREAEVSA